MNITDLRRMGVDRARIESNLLGPAQVEDGFHPVVGQRPHASLRELRQVIGSQQRPPACPTTVHSWITAQVAGVQQGGKGQQSFWVVHHTKETRAVRQY